MVQNLADSANCREARQRAEDLPDVRVFQRRGSDHPIGARRAAQLVRNPPSFRKACQGERRILMPDVANAHCLDADPSGQLEPADCKVALEVGQGIDGVPVRREQLQWVMAARSPIGDVPDVEVRVPDSHAVNGLRGRSSGHPAHGQHERFIDRMPIVLERFIPQNIVPEFG